MGEIILQNNRKRQLRFHSTLGKIGKIASLNRMMAQEHRMMAWEHRMMAWEHRMMAREHRMMAWEYKLPL